MFQVLLLGRMAYPRTSPTSSYMLCTTPSAAIRLRKKVVNLINIMSLKHIFKTCYIFQVPLLARMAYPRTSPTGSYTPCTTPLCCDPPPSRSSWWDMRCWLSHRETSLQNRSVKATYSTTLIKGPSGYLYTCQRASGKILTIGISYSLLIKIIIEVLSQCIKYK